METMVINDVPPDKLDFYRELARSLGGRMTSIAPEPDGEFTVVIIVPKGDCRRSTADHDRGCGPGVRSLHVPCRRRRSRATGAPAPINPACIRVLDLAADPVAKCLH